MTETIALRTANATDRIALRGVRMRGRLAGMTARMTAEQTFVNLEARPIEAVYTFPLPENAAVCGFQIIFGDRVLTGVVEEKEQAIEQYEDALDEGHGAFLLEQERADVFTVRVGSLKPNQAVTIRLDYVFDLEVVDGKIRIALPTTIAPRFASASGMDPVDAMIAADALNPPHVLCVPYGLSLEIEAQLNLKGISSPSHAIDARQNEGDYWRVNLAGGIAEMDRDVVLELELARDARPAAICEADADGEAFLAVTFIPEFDERDMGRAVAGETVFVLDCSGSMEGESIARASAALECCLRAMSAGERFNVCRFGSTFELLWPQPELYDEATMAQAIAFVRRGANLGGTELLAPLESVLAGRPTGVEVRNVVVLTDGQISNEPAVIALARRRRGHNRLFTFGIGSACGRSLVSGLARVSGGAAEFISANERIEEKVLRMFSRIASPPVTDVEIDYGGVELEQAPRAIPPVFDEDSVRVFARLIGSRRPEEVTLRCRVGGSQKSWCVAVRPAREGEPVLGTFWARAAIRELEDQEDPRAGATSPEQSRLVQLSRRYGLLCGRTSFIAVEHRSEAERAEGRPALRRVPVMLAKGWGGVDALRMRAVGGSSTNASVLSCDANPPGALALPSARGHRSGVGQFLHRMLRAERKVVDSPPSGGFCEERSFPAEAAPAPSAPADELLALLATQNADGAFGDDGVINQLLASSGAERSQLESAIRQCAGAQLPGDAAGSNVVRTMLALYILHRNFAARRRTWKRAASKAVDFIAGQTGVDAGVVNGWVTSLVRG